MSSQVDHSLLLKHSSLLNFFEPTTFLRAATSSLHNSYFLGSPFNQGILTFQRYWYPDAYLTHSICRIIQPATPKTSSSSCCASSTPTASCNQTTTWLLKRWASRRKALRESSPPTYYNLRICTDLLQFCTLQCYHAEVGSCRTEESYKWDEGHEAWQQA